VNELDEDDGDECSVEEDVVLSAPNESWTTDGTYQEHVIEWRQWRWGIAQREMRQRSSLTGRYGEET
jgi:hypothetical protein